MKKTQVKFLSNGKLVEMDGLGQVEILGMHTAVVSRTEHEPYIIIDQVLIGTNESIELHYFER